MRYIPPKKNNAPAVLSGMCIFAAAVCLLHSGAPYMPRGVLQIFGVGFAVACIQLTQRFVLTSFEYELLSRLSSDGTAYYGGEALADDGTEPFDGRYDFAVVRVQGTRRKTVCSLSCSSLRAVYGSDKKSCTEAAEKYGKPALVYNFRRNLFGARQVNCMFEFNDKLAEIRLECDEAFEAELKSRISAE